MRLIKLLKLICSLCRAIAIIIGAVCDMLRTKWAYEAHRENTLHK